MGLPSPAVWVMDPRQEAMGYRIAPGTDGVPGQSTLPLFAGEGGPLGLRLPVWASALWACFGLPPMPCNVSAFHKT